METPTLEFETEEVISYNHAKITYRLAKIEYL